MAQFKLSLLTTAADATTNSFVATTITDYVGQSAQYKNRTSTDIQAHQTQFTYAEKLSLKQNSQKELTFSALRNVFIQQDWTINPYVNLLHVGSLLELQDKYGHTSLFIINKIAFNFQTNNIEYQYTCQDAFSYQHTRQQSGYTIENDASEDDYIGPKSIDWWVIRKIAPECRIQYEYIPLEIGVYQDQYGSFIKFNQTEQTAWDEETPRTILKSPITSIVDGVDEFQETFAFSCSNATAASVLISLGDNLGLMPHAAEYRVDNEDGTISYRRMFWFEPQENAEVTGIKYSPDRDISKFDLNFSGSSLTTVLNVDSNEVGDELVTLFPNTPGFFTQMFMDNEQWNKDVSFAPGFFSSSNRQQFSYTPNSMTETTDGYMVVPLTSTEKFYVKTRYEYFQFAWDDTTFSRVVFLFDGEQVVGYESRNVTFGLRFTDGSNIVDVWEGDKLPSSITQKDWNISLIVAKPANVTTVALSSSEVYLTFYHLFTDEEREFAKVADTCPWLENKLIDFSYFLQQGIITPAEYSSLLSKFNNDLRLINGKLMYYTDEYYRALKTKTSVLANMQNEIDSIGAQVEADIIAPARAGKKVNDLVELQKAYHTLFNPAQATSGILNRDELVTDYFEKYFNAEQRFLKNVYAFRQYFNSAVSISGNATIKQYKLTAPIRDPSAFLGLSRVPYSSWSATTTSSQYAQKLTDSRFKIFDVVNEANVGNYGVSTYESGTIIPMEELSNYSYNYNSNCKYYLTADDFESYFGVDQSPEDVIYQGGNSYYQLTTTQICNLILREKSGQYYIRDTEKYAPLDYVRIDPDYVFRYITWMSFPKLCDYWLNGETDWTTINIGNVLHDGYGNFDREDNNQFKDATKAGTETFLSSYYKAYFPVTEIYYYGSKIITITNEDGLTTYAQVNADGEKDTTTDYKEYQPMVFMSGGYSLLDCGPRSNSDTELLCQQLTSSFPYAATAAIFWNNARLSALSIELADRNNTEDYSYNWLTDTTSAAEETQMYTRNLVDSYYANFGTSYEDLVKCAELVRQYYEGNNGVPVPDFVSNKRGNNKPATWYTKSPEAPASSYTFELSEETKKVATQYYNYYKYIVPTFNYQRRRRPDNLANPASLEKFYDKDNNNLYIKNKYLRILKAGDVVNSDDTYVRIPLWGDTQENDIVWPTDQTKTLQSMSTFYIYMHREGEEPNEKNLTDNWFKNRFSSILWYPLNQRLQTISWAGWNGAYTETLKEAIALRDTQYKEETSFTDDNSRIFTTKTNPGCVKYIYCHVEDYEKGILITGEGSYKGSDDYTIQISTTDKDLSRVFDVNTDQVISTLKIEKALEPYSNKLYLSTEQTLSTRLATKDDLASTWLPIYKNLGNDTWVQVYTTNQLTAAAKGDYPLVLDKATFATIYDIDRTAGELITYNEETDPTAATIEVFACSFTSNSDGTYSLSTNSLGEKEITFGKDSSFEYNKKKYSGTININTSTDVHDPDHMIVTTLSSLTNGQFWQNYHQDSANAYLFEQAAAIETQLQTYWDQAYTASKYCKYFLPESWQPYTDQSTNTFTKDILLVDKENHVSLSSKYLPAVEIYTDAANESTLSIFVNKHYLPKYDWELTSVATAAQTSNNEYNENVLAEHDESNYINPAETPLIANNRAIQDAMVHLGTSLDKWRVVKNGYTTYYYVLSGGMLWKDVPQYLASSVSLEHLDGQYGMFYYLITHNYTSYETPQYNDLKQQQLRFWQNIHDQYPYLILESNYSYSLATTSEELLKMAQLVFKGMKEPERAYSLTVIDMANLSGYKGQELVPGQGILLDASKYYATNDDIYRALSQYLFISDVSYDLRSDASISVTVNSIKYQEKLLQSLVKLIR